MGRRFPWSIVVVLLFSAGPLGIRVRGQDHRHGRAGIDVLRKTATKVVAPEFPDQALKLHQQGVVVAEIVVSRMGALERVEILESPSPALAAAVSRAVEQWKFPTTSKMEVGVMGKIVYYFLIADGKPLVLTSAEAPRADHNRRKQQRR